VHDASGPQLSLHDTTSGGAGGRFRTLSLLAVSGALAVPLLLLLLVHVVVNRPPVSTALQQEATRAVSARFPGALVGTVRVGLFGSVTLRGFEMPGPELDSPPTLTADRLIIHPAWLDVLRGHFRAASLELRWVRLHPGPSGRWARSLLHRAPPKREEPAGREPASPTPAELIVRDLFVDLPFAGSNAPLALGPLDLRGRWFRGEGEWHFQVTGDLLDGEGGRFAAIGRRTDRGEVFIEANVDKLLVTDLPPGLLRRADLELSDGRISGRLSGTFETAEGLTAEGTIEARVDQGRLDWPRLAEGPVTPLQLGLSGDYRWAPAERTLYVRHGQVTVGGARAELDGALSFSSPPTLEVEVRVVHLDLQGTIDTLAVQMRPPPEAPRVEGDVSADIAVRVELSRWDSLQLRRAELDLAGRTKGGGRGGDNWMRQSFLYQPSQTEENPRAFEVGPGNPHFVPISAVPQVLIKAVLLSEDAGFYGHHGFDFEEIRDSLGRDLAEGQAVRGGSTLTQQLVKNLFLSREKTLARKIQEALITLQVEASLPKERILEIYLNTIEWGPRIYGIGEASERYFNVRPDALTPKQAAFLATIIPSPRRYYHLYYERGTLTPRWEERVDTLLEKMQQTGVIDMAAFQQAIATPLVFVERQGGATQIRTGE
jgi:penicillin-binding protein 1A